MFEPEIVPYVEQTYQLQTGDKIFVYTDGLTEWSNPKRDLFSFDRLRGSLQKNGHLDLNTIFTNLMQDIHEFSQGVECDDDITILGFQFTG